MMANMRIYLAGPVSGIKNDNREKFLRAKSMLENDGSNVEVTTPFDLDIPKPNGFSKQEEWNYYMGYCLSHVLSNDVDMVVVLQDWLSSEGACTEVYVAKKAGIKVRVFHETQDWFYMTTVEEAQESEDILLEANGLVNGDRNNSYGHPFYDYTKTAGFWSIVLKDKLKEDLTPEDAIMCMMLMKISREMNKHKKDNLTDLAGYAQCLQKTILKRREIERNE